VKIMLADALKLVVRCFEDGIRNNNDANLLPSFNSANFLALLIHQKGRDFHRQMDHDFGGRFLHRLFFHDA